MGTIRKEPPQNGRAPVYLLDEGISDIENDRLC